MKTLLRWFQSKAHLIRHIKRLERRLERERDAVQSLERQRDTALDMLDRVAWRDRNEAVQHKAAVEAMRGGQQ